jgi:hypothetical protein
VARRFAQPLGIHRDAWEGCCIETERGIVRLTPVLDRAERLVGKEGAEAVGERLGETPSLSNHRCSRRSALYPQESDAKRLLDAKRLAVPC